MVNFCKTHNVQPYSSVASGTGVFKKHSATDTSQVANDEQIFNALSVSSNCLRETTAGRFETLLLASMSKLGCYFSGPS